MVEISKIRIKKKAYQFDVKRRYQHVSHFKLKERTPLDRMKDQLRSFLTPKKKEKKAEAPPSPGGFNFVVFGAAILIAIIILGIGWTYFALQAAQVAPGVFQPQLEKPTIGNKITGAEILTAGERGSEQRVAAVLVEYEANNINNYTVSVTTYEGKIPSEVFILNSAREDATSYADFLRSLRSNLAKRKIVLNEISEKQLESMPDGAIVIIPSGYMPSGMLGVDSSITMDKLAERGVVIIYIGLPFNKMLTGSGVVSTPENITKNLPVSFDESASLTTTDDFHLFQPLYRAVARSGWQGSLIYGSASVIKKDDGAFIFLPQTLDGGWRNNYTSAAEDIAKIVFDIPWAQPHGPAKVYEFTNITNCSGASYFFSEPFDSEKATIKVDFTAYSPASNYPVQETLLTRKEKDVLGQLYMEGGTKVVSTNITNEEVRLNARLQEPNPGQANMFVVITNVNGTDERVLPQGSINIQAEKPLDIRVETDRGEYIVKLIDDGGKVYAQSYMKVVSIDIKWAGLDRQRPYIYLFDVSMDGAPVTLGDVRVRVDDGKYGNYQFNNVQAIAIDVGTYTGGDQLPFGSHEFEFTAGGLNVAVPVERTRIKTIFDDPLFWLTIIVTLGIVGVGIVFARQESVFFAIDIPDFPPVARTKVPLSPDVILSVFQKVNDNYRWQNTPLTPAEIKNGFKDVFYKGKAIYVTDYNIEYLLEELGKRGEVKESMGYYGLVGWEGKTKHSINYLAMMRRLRDICVNNAIPFTSIGESELADSEITVVGQQMFLHFFEKGADLKKLIKSSLSTIGKGITLVLFKNAAEKSAYQSMILSPSAAPVIARMESDSGSLQFLTFDEFEKMLTEFKAM